MSKRKAITIISRIFSHLLFWLVAIFVFAFIFRLAKDVSKLDVIYSLFFHFSIIIGVYINFYWIDKFLNKGFSVRYLLLLAITIASIVLLNTYTFSVLIDLILPDLYIINQFGAIEITIISILYLTITSAIKVSKSWFDLQKSKHQMTEAEKEKVDSELQSLKSQINPHFLFNSLNVIYSLTLKNDKSTPEVVLKLSDILRYVIYDSTQEKVLLSSEIALLKKYIDLQKYRIDNDASINMADELNNDAKVAPLIFLTLLENSFKHGIKGDVENVFINVKITSDNKKVYFEIENNKAHTEQNSDSTKGIGLDNIKKRLALEYPDKHKLKIDEKDNKFSVYLEIEYED